MNGVVRAAALGLALAALAPAAEAQGMTRSEALLSGFERYRADRGTLPETLDVPAGWLEGFKRMAAETQKSGREVGACLSVTTDSGLLERSRAALVEYRALLAAQKEAPTDNFVADEARLRRQVEDRLGASSDGRAEWAVGRSQAGLQFSVRTERDLARCDSSVAGTAHSHPPPSEPGLRNETPSFADVGNSLRETFKRIAVVVGSQRMCILVLPRRVGATLRTEVDAILEQAAWRDVDAALLAVDPAGLPQPFDAQRASDVGNAMAGAILRDHGGALYCGGYDGHLAIVKESVPGQLKSGQTSVWETWAAKSAVLTARMLFYPEWPVIDFDMSDDDRDHKFFAYLFGLRDRQGRSFWKPGLTLQDFEEGGASRISLGLLDLAQPNGRDIEMTVGQYAVPDTHGRLDPTSIFQSSCLPKESGVRCYLVKRMSDDSVPQVQFANMVPGQDEWWFVQPVSGGYAMRSQSRDPPLTYEGGVVQVGTRWVKQGQGTLNVPAARYVGEFARGDFNGHGVFDTATFTYDGDFADGRMHGKGRYLRKENGRWYPVTAVQGKITVDASAPP